MCVFGTERMRRIGDDVCRIVTWLVVVVVALVGAGDREVCASPKEFSTAREGLSLAFPRDHGAHPDYQTEWWYYTGQLYEAGKIPFVDSPRYGFQLTFFRRASSGVEGMAQEYLAHGAITDVRNQRTFFASRVGGGALGVAGVAQTGLMAWSGDWSADLVGSQHLLRFSLPVDAASGGPFSIRLVGTSSSPEWSQGKSGYSRKGACPSCASIYYSVPELRFEANVFRGQEGSLESLRGVGWMDHEFMSNSLDRSHQGWDWMGLMFKDGRHLMVFRLRGENGETDYASGTLRGPAGSIELGAGDFSMTPLEWWSSPKTGAKYPIAWRVDVPTQGISTVVAARVPACEIGGEGAAGGPQYWEGPVAAADESVLGYLEMTGYAGKVSL